MKYEANENNITKYHNGVKVYISSTDYGSKLVGVIYTFTP